MCGSFASFVSNGPPSSGSAIGLREAKQSAGVPRVHRLQQV
jgi:hypothetical protein